MAEASTAAFEGTWTGGWRGAPVRITANGQHGIRGVFRGSGDAGFVCFFRGSKIRGYWWDSDKNVFPKDSDTCTVELTLESGVVSGVAVDKSSSEFRWTLRRVVVPRDGEGKIAEFRYKDSAAFERLTKLPVVDTRAAQAEGLSASVREVASATATGLRGFSQPSGNAQGDITYIPPLSLYSPYDAASSPAALARSASRAKGKQLLTSTTGALMLQQKVHDAPEWVEPADRPRSRSASRNNRPSLSATAPATPAAAASSSSGEADADAEVAAATGGAGPSPSPGGGGGRQSRSGGGGGGLEGRPPFRPVSALHFSAAEDSKAPFISTLVSADTAPEDLAKTARAAMAASSGVARAAQSQHLHRGPDGRLGVVTSPTNFLLPLGRPVSSLVAAPFAEGDSYDVMERIRRQAQLRGAVGSPVGHAGRAAKALHAAASSTSRSAGGAAAAAAAAAEAAASPFRPVGPANIFLPSPSIDAAATDFADTPAGKAMARRTQSAGPGGRRPGSAAAGAAPGAAAERPVFMNYSKDFTADTGLYTAGFPEYRCAPPADPRECRPGSPERKALLAEIAKQRSGAGGGGAAWKEVVTPGVRPLATPGVQTMPANLIKLRPVASRNGSATFRESPTSPRKMSMAVAVMYGRSNKTKGLVSYAGSNTVRLPT